MFGQIKNVVNFRNIMTQGDWNKMTRLGRIYTPELLRLRHMKHQNISVAQHSPQTKKYFDPEHSCLHTSTMSRPPEVDFVPGIQMLKPKNVLFEEFHDARNNQRGYCA